MNIWDLQRNETRIAHGAVMVLGKNAEKQDVSVTVARIHHSNKAFQTAAENIKKIRQTEIDSAKPEDLQKIMSEITTEAAKISCITGWANFTFKDGSPMPCTQENIEFIHTTLPELFDRIVQFGVSDANYLGTFNEEDSVKN